MRFYARDKPRTAALVGWGIYLSAFWFMTSVVLGFGLLSLLAHHHLVGDTARLGLWGLVVRVEWLACLRAAGDSQGHFERWLPNVPISWQVFSAALFFTVLPLSLASLASSISWVVAAKWLVHEHWGWQVAVQGAVYYVAIQFVDSLDRYRPAPVGPGGVGRATAWEMEQFGME